MPKHDGDWTFDAADTRILRALQEDGRMTWAELAERVGLSAPATTERVRKLEREGVIHGFQARLDPGALGVGTLAYVAVTIRDPSEHTVFMELARAVDEILECHIVAGPDDYLLKVRCGQPADLAGLIRDRIRTMPGVSSTRTIVVLETVKESAALPIPEARD